MVKALIVEPDHAAARHLTRALRACGLVRVLAVAHTVEECLQLLVTEEPDAILIGALAGDDSAVALGHTLAEAQAPPLLAFVTPDPAHAAEAFDLDAVDYVTATAGSRGFARRIARMADRLERARGRATAVPEAGAAPVPPAAPPLRRLPVKDYAEGTVRLIDPASLICAQRSNRRVVLRTISREYPTYFTIEALARRLAPAGFFRAAAGTLINLDHVEHLIPNGDGSYDALLRAGAQTINATVSRSRARELLSLLDPV